MYVLPSIDLRAGQVVRLIQGDYDRQRTYGTDPAVVAREFAAAGATWIHVVDLDAARTGRPANTEAVRAIRAASEGLKVELGGGMRDDDAIEAALGELADRVVIGSAAMKDWPWFENLCRRAELAGRIALGLDARDGRVSIHGWTEQVDVAAVDVARRVTGWPLGAIVYTDIARDGMLGGFAAEATAEIVTATDVPVIASGGVSSLVDVARCREIGCAGAIIGRAYYEGAIDLAAAIEQARRD
jgi:phosphoribosylformimino-5-aminoimidazole carboxamide ribotide isomerase